MANIEIAQNAALQIMDMLQKAESTLENANSITANVQNSLEMEVASRANIDQNLTAIRRVFNNSQEHINRVITVGREAVSESDQRDHTQQQRAEQVQMNSSIPVLGGTAAIGFLGLYGMLFPVSRMVKDWIKNIINPVMRLDAGGGETVSRAVDVPIIANEDTLTSTNSSGVSIYSAPNRIITDAKSQARQSIGLKEFNEKIDVLKSKYPAYQSMDDIGKDIILDGQRLSSGTFGFDKSGSCIAYAKVMCYEVFGKHWNEWNQVLRDDDPSLDNISVGDYLLVHRTSGDFHAVFVTGIEGELIRYTDANWIYPSKVRWDCSVSKSELLTNKDFEFVTKTSHTETVC